MKAKLINALYDALYDTNSVSCNDIIANQDTALINLYDERIAPHIQDENLLSDLSEILDKASRAAFAKAFEAMAALTQN